MNFTFEKNTWKKTFETSNNTYNKCLGITTITVNGTKFIYLSYEKQIGAFSVHTYTHTEVISKNTK